MAFNLMAVSQTEIDWPGVQQAYRDTEQLFEIFPIPEFGPGDAIGISLPMNHFNQDSWSCASRFLRTIAGEVQFTLYDMYLGQAVELGTYVPGGIDAC